MQTINSFPLAHVPPRRHLARMGQITNREELEAWLKDKPREWSAAIALRAALRVVAFAVNPGRFDNKRTPAAFILKLFRALAITAATPHFPASAIGRTAPDTAAYSAAFVVGYDTGHAGDTDAAEAVCYACNTVDSAFNYPNAPADRNHAAAYAAETALAAAGSGTDGVYSINDTYFASKWKATVTDADFIDQSKTVQTLLSLPLWPSEVPHWMAIEIDAMRASLRNSPDGFGLWMDWYERRLAGHATGFALPIAQDEEMYRRLVAQDDDWWKREPAEVNTEIQSWLDELTPPSDAEPQSDFGLIFRQRADDLFEVDQFAGTDEVLDTPEARDRHEHLRDTLSEALTLAAGHNQASSLAPRFEKWKELLGDEPRQMRLGRLLQHAELMLKLTEAMAQEIRDMSSLSQLPENSRNLVALLEALPTAHWAMVNFDPALARRSTLQADPDAPRTPMLAIDVTLEVVTDAAQQGVLTQDSAHDVTSMAEGLEVAAPDPRRLQRFWETGKNLVRAVGSFLWKHKKKALGVPAAAIAAAKFLVQYEDWVLSLFVGHPGMLNLLTQLINWLKQFPFLA